MTSPGQSGSSLLSGKTSEPRLNTPPLPRGTSRANNIDLLQEVGPNVEQVIRNYFASGNSLHLPDASYDALNQETLYSYNTYGQLTGIQRPGGLVTTNVYFTSGDDVSRLAYTYDYSGSESSGATPLPTAADWSAL
jgi:YD repeat-containing protein